MIKCDGFGKLLKPLFSILSIGFFGLLGNSFVNGAGAFLPVGINLSASAVNSGYNIAFHKGGGVFTSFLGQGKSVLALDKDRVFWWAPNGFPYVYLRSDNRAPTIQGFFDRYFTCDEFGSNNNLSISNCSLVDYIDYSGDNQYIKDQFKSFFSNINSGDYGYYDYQNNQYIGATYDYRNNYIWVCFSSHTIGQSICFMGGYCYNEGACNGNLINSQGLQDLSYGMISYSWVGYAPGQVGYGGGGNIDGDSSNSVNVSLSGNLMYNNSCTNGYVISKLNSLYGNNLINVCYAGTYNTGLIDNSFNGVPYLSHNGLSYKELFKLTSDGMGWSSWFSTYENEMLRYKNGSLNVNPFLSRPIALYSYFENLYNGGFLGWDNSNGMGSFLYLNYCNLYFNSDYNSIYSGSYFKSYCDDLNYSSSSDYNFSTGEIGSIDDEEILPPGFDLNNNSSSNVVGVSWDGTLSGESNLNFDGKNFINSFYQKLQSSYQKPLNNSVGFLPTYILVFLCGLILFRFISH